MLLHACMQAQASDQDDNDHDDGKDPTLGGFIDNASTPLGWSNYNTFKADATAARAEDRPNREAAAKGVQCLGSL